MTIIFVLMFGATLFLCLSSYALYPLVIWGLSRVQRFRIQYADIAPSISVIISAFNESKHIEKKMENTLSLEYPKGKMEILIGSDGSTDETETIAKKFIGPGIHVFPFKENRGKTIVQNDLVAHAKSDILVFTDAASFLPPDALRKVVRNFADDRIGCVAGKMRFVNTESNVTTRSQGIYWRYESKIRKWESDLGRMIGVDGPLYAIRKKYYIPLGSNIISDMISPLLVLAQGKGVVLEPEALVDEEPKRQSHQEFSTRRRIILRGLIALSAHRALLNPLGHSLLTLQILFHKIVRWFVGPLVILNAFSCVMLSGHLFFQIFLVLYSLFLIAAIVGKLTDQAGIRTRLLSIPYYFGLVNLAATAGIIDFFRNKQAISWIPVRD